MATRVRALEDLLCVQGGAKVPMPRMLETHMQSRVCETAQVNIRLQRGARSVQVCCVGA
jgi:hypothetical protein